MNAAVFLQGVVIGFSIAAPVGPIGILCMRRSLVHGAVAGFVSGLGAATADAIYGCVAALGLSFATEVLLAQKNLLGIVGGTFLCLLGVRTFLSRPADRTSQTKPASLLGGFLATLLLTLTNPMTILSFAAVFAGLGALNPDYRPDFAPWLVMGVFAGSAAWWLILSALASLLREKMDHRVLRWVNMVAGVVISGYGLVAILSSI